MAGGLRQDDLGSKSEGGSKTRVRRRVQLFLGVRGARTTFLRRPRQPPVFFGKNQNAHRFPSPWTHTGGRGGGSPRLGARPWSSWPGRMAGAVMAPGLVVLGGAVSSAVVGGRESSAVVDGGDHRRFACPVDPARTLGQEGGQAQVTRRGGGLRITYRDGRLRRSCCGSRRRRVVIF